LPERIIFGTCGCAFFQDNLLNKGPCEHMVALFRLSAALPKGLPVSVAAAPEALPVTTNMATGNRMKSRNRRSGGKR